MTEILSRNGMNAHQVAAYSMIMECWQKPAEFQGLLELLMEDPPEVLIEVGAGRGGAFWAFCQVAAPGALLISVDQGEVEGAHCASVDMLRSFGLPDQQVVCIRGDSKDARTAAGVNIALQGRKADFVFIDADHREEAVRRDHFLYSQFAREGGLVGLHDIIPVTVNRWTPEYAVEVAPLWEDIKACDVKTREFIQEDDLTWGGIGVYEQPAYRLVILQEEAIP
jgi:cephalosporin hydroxylase